MAHRPTGLSSAPAAATAAVRGADINLTTRVDLTRRRSIHRGGGSETRTPRIIERCHAPPATLDRDG